MTDSTSNIKEYTETMYFISGFLLLWHIIEVGFTLFYPSLGFSMIDESNTQLISAIESNANILLISSALLIVIFVASCFVSYYFHKKKGKSLLALLISIFPLVGTILGTCFFEYYSILLYSGIVY